MDEAFSESLKIGLLLSKTNAAMSEAEAIESCKIYFNIISSQNINDLLILELQEKTKSTNIIKLAKIWLQRLALTREAYVIIGRIAINAKNNDKPQIELLAKNWDFLKYLSKEQNPSFKISTRNVNISEGTKDKHEPVQNKTAFKAVVELLAKISITKAKMQSPDLEFVILKAQPSFVGIAIWQNTDKFELRRAHLRPVLHPTAMNPRLARAMINLAGAEKEVFDPFCGAGGLLLEAANIGINAAGTDISSAMIERARANIAVEPPEIQSRLNLTQMDAFDFNLHVECVATDLPYGKSSKLNSTLENLMSQFLAHYSALTDKMAVCFPKGTKIEISSKWIKKYEFDIYIHKSLTRTILVLEKNKP